MKKCKGIICAVILCMLLPVSVYAHPGRTDSAGGTMIIKIKVA